MVILWNSFLTLCLTTQKVNFPTDRPGKNQVKVALKKYPFQIPFNIKRKRAGETQTPVLRVLKARSENLCDDSLKKAAFMCDWAHLYNVF